MKSGISIALIAAAGAMQTQDAITPSAALKIFITKGNVAKHDARFGSKLRTTANKARTGKGNGKRVTSSGGADDYADDYSGHIKDTNGDSTTTTSTDVVQSPFVEQKDVLVAGLSPADQKKYGTRGILVKQSEDTKEWTVWMYKSGSTRTVEEKNMSVVPKPYVESQPEPKSGSEMPFIKEGSIVKKFAYVNGHKVNGSYGVVLQAQYHGREGERKSDSQGCEVFWFKENSSSVVNPQHIETALDRHVYPVVKPTSRQAREPASDSETLFKVGSIVVINQNVINPLKEKLPKLYQWQQDKTYGLLQKKVHRDGVDLWKVIMFLPSPQGTTVRKLKEVKDMSVWLTPAVLPFKMGSIVTIKGLGSDAEQKYNDTYGLIKGKFDDGSWWVKSFFDNESIKLNEKNMSVWLTHVVGGKPQPNSPAPEGGEKSHSEMPFKEGSIVEIKGVKKGKNKKYNDTYGLLKMKFKNDEWGVQSLLDKEFIKLKEKDMSLWLTPVVEADDSKEKMSTDQPTPEPCPPTYQQACLSRP